MATHASDANTKKGSIVKIVKSGTGTHRKGG